MRNSEYEVTFSKDTVKFQIDKFSKGQSIGQLRKATKVPDGIARVIFESTNIQEGQFIGYKLNGYGRLFHKTGNYYIG